MNINFSRALQKKLIKGCFIKKRKLVYILGYNEPPCIYQYIYEIRYCRVLVV